ncbi:hypothetical protein HHK36_018388 [Tetracentron sinense]|uniref:RRM domain-containing protein n=1 Tax=Tetracentron sinense TaxID=13715 RepID=A0A834Z4D4_TETSI|nr:hypothetical protein HHK36_018388 [Tetracentron sinense]
MLLLSFPSPSFSDSSKPSFRGFSKMSSALDMSLDDLIENNKKSGGNSRGRGRGSGLGPSRRFPNRGANRTTPYSSGKFFGLNIGFKQPVQAPDSAWQHDMFRDQVAAYPAQAGRSSAVETGAKLYISNLDYGVSNEDIKVRFLFYLEESGIILWVGFQSEFSYVQELFSEVGDLKRYSIHYDRSGRSKGTAELVFSRRADAVAAVKRYNNVQLDGKPMKIEIVGTNIATPVAVSVATNGMFGNPNRAPRGGQGWGGSMGRPRGGGSGGRGVGRGRGWGRGRDEKISAEDLDADLEKYHTEAMQIN